MNNTKKLMKDKASNLLVKKHFEENSFIQSDIESYNAFVEKEMQRIVDDNEEIEPTIIPDNVEEFKVELGDIRMGKPEITEADGSTRDLLPSEARMRKLDYSAPVYMELTSYVNGVERENFEMEIGKIPVMVGSDYCHLSGMTDEELIEAGEDPNDVGGYFVVNGTEKVLVAVEDLAPNRYLVEESRKSRSEYVGKIFSEEGSYKIPHSIEKRKDEIFYMTFTRVKNVPVLAIIKALGLTKDEEIMEHIGLDDESEVFINLYEFTDLETREEAADYVAKEMGITQSKDIRVQRVTEILDKYLLPHIGNGEEYRKEKARNLCKYLKEYVLVSNGELPLEDKDHYSNKRLKMAGELLSDLFRVNLKVLVGDFLYNFQRIVKRGKFPSVKTIIRDKLLTQRMYSAMATGNWVGGRKGISQRIERLNYIQLLSSLQRVVSPLSSSQENFDARALHPTHMGRLGMSETPEGTNIGLRKNLALLSKLTREINEDELINSLENMGLNTVN